MICYYLGSQKSQTKTLKQSYCNEQDISNDKSTNNNLEETKIATNEPQLPPEVNNLYSSAQRNKKRINIWGTCSSPRPKYYRHID